MRQEFEKPVISTILSGHEKDSIHKKAVDLEFTGLFGNVSAPDAYIVKLSINNKQQINFEAQKVLAQDPSTIVGKAWTKIFGNEQAEIQPKTPVIDLHYDYNNMNLFVVEEDRVYAI